MYTYICIYFVFRKYTFLNRKHVHEMRSLRGERRLLPMYFVAIDNNEETKKILKGTSHLDYIKIYAKNSNQKASCSIIAANILIIADNVATYHSGVSNAEITTQLMNAPNQNTPGSLL